jgi:hypothetical protein
MTRVVRRRAPGLLLAVSALALGAPAGCSVDSTGISTVQVNDGSRDNGSGGRGGSGGVGTGGSGGAAGGGGSQAGAGGGGGSAADMRLDVPGDQPPADVPALGVNGQACGAGSGCQTGFCVDGVCCETACAGSCNACRAAKTGQADGACRPVTTGTDPDDECELDSSNLCGRTGMCNGAGACAVAAANLACGETKCMGSSLTPRPRCNGMGTCEARPVEPCPGGLRCASATTCKVACAADADCVTGQVCNTAEGRCQPGLAVGAACDAMGASGGCASGFCVDGVCCESACTGTCRGCTMARTGMPSGQCGPVRVGTDPDNECSTQDRSTCGRDGMCDGQGACRRYPDGTTCGTTCCSRGQGGNRPCNYVCDNGSCDMQDPVPGTDSCTGFSCCCPTGGTNGEAACVSPLACPAGACM